MDKTITETQRRRKIQQNYNKANDITPKTVRKSVREVIEATKPIKDSGEERSPLEMTRKELKKYVVSLEKEMKEAASQLQFEKAAMLRDKVFEYKARL